MSTANANNWGGVSGATGSRADAQGGLSGTLWQTLKVLGSLKLTVALFAFSLVLVLVGTFAQEELNMVEVKKQYFTSWVAMTEFEHFVPQAFFPHENRIPGKLPLPGGALVGLLLMINLIAAKVTRFHVRARGSKLLVGSLVFAFGLLLTVGVVVGGNAEGVQGQPPISYKTLWSGLVAGMVVLWLAAVYEAINSERRGWKLIWGGIALFFGGMGLAALLGSFQMSASSLRITWQLIEGLIVATVLLVGARMMFAAQGGNLLLHFGVALLMVGQFVFGDTQLEQRLSLVEGQSTNTLINLDHVELAVIEDLGDGKQRVSVIPEKKLKGAQASKEVIQDERLPFDVKVLEFFDHSELESAAGQSTATEGLGKEMRAVELPVAGGTESSLDMASTYVELLDKQSGESLGVYLASQMANEQGFLSFGSSEDMLDSVAVGDSAYQLQLRFTRVPKPYWVKVEDVRRINYSGTNTPRDYSSFIKLVDTETGNVENARVWMNNPLRYRGETFYQADYQQLPGGKEFTSIQVVRNAGWMIPYIACMIVAVGMIAHFVGTLDRFLGRREREVARALESHSEEQQAEREISKWPVVITPVFAGVVCLMAVVPWSSVMRSMRPGTESQSMNFYAAGEIPVRFGGRVMPLNAYAADALQAVSNRTSLPLTARSEEDLPPAPDEIKDRAGRKSRLSAMQWLFEVASGSRAIADLQMFRIDADEVLDHFEIKRRKSKLYSLTELSPKLADFDTVVSEASSVARRDEKLLTFKQRKFLELASRLDAFQKVAMAFREPPLPRIPPQFDTPDLTDDQRVEILAFMLDRQLNELANAKIAGVVPPVQEDAVGSVDTPPWRPLSWGRIKDLIATQIQGRDPTPGVAPFTEMIDAYLEEDPLKFNDAVSEQVSEVAAAAPADYHAPSVQLERWLEATYSTMGAIILYGLFMLAGIVALAVNAPRLRAGIWWGLVVVAVVHTTVVLARVYITGRAPVINLYSSAVFIGLATVLAGLVFERLFRHGIGNLIAASTGMLSLMVASALNDGDTMPVLQAVLDTQFWLATHVITVTLGYAATFVAGGLGVIYLLVMALDDGEDKTVSRDMYRMIYSAACFGILFSFVGTVLGGLWADDSWGRFWGWDPKENGALLIVIWNALILHARWDRMVGERGFAMLAVGGNVVTAWSWFGTNQLGLGLHAYGGASGAPLALGLFMLANVVVLLLGWKFTKAGAV